MADRWVEIADGFWNVRGSFKTARVLDIGTQCSLVRLQSGGFALLDAYFPDPPVLQQILDLTDQGRAIEAVINLHPFHTVHVKRVAKQFPNARWYGTQRHVDKAPEVAWDALRTDDPAMNERFEGDLWFTVPPGVDFVPANENLHFASVLALHRASRTLHVDDTLTWVHLPFVWGLRFHPTLKRVLKQEPGAVAAFRSWAEQLVEVCATVDHLCTAHLRPLPPGDPPVAAQVAAALSAVQKVLSAHEARHG